MDRKKSDVLQGTLDLMILKTLHALGPLHGFGIARRLEQVSRDVLQLNEGTVYTSLLRVQQQGWITAEGHVGEQPQGQVLLHHRARAEAARGGNGELGAHLRRDSPRPAAGTGRRAMSARRASRLRAFAAAARLPCADEP